MASTHPIPIATQHDHPPQPGPGWKYLLLISSFLLIIAALVGWQIVSIVHNNTTDPTIAGRPLSNTQTHLHTVVASGKPGVLYLGTHYGLFTSTDGGRTWPQARGILNGFMITTIAVSPKDANTLALVAIPSTASAAAEGIYFSQDGGTTWILRNPPGLSLSAYPYTVQAGTAGSGHFYAFYLNGGWFETRDRGLHWHPFAQNNVPQMQNPRLLTFMNNPNHLLLGGDQGLFESRDDGQTWQNLTTVQGYVQSLVVSNTLPATIFCATDQGLYTWKDGNGDTQIKQVTLPGAVTFSRLTMSTNGEILYALAAQALWYSQDGGMHWTLRTHFKRGDVIALVIDPGTTKTLYVGFFLPAQVLFSTDSGEKWRVLADSATP